MFSLPLIYKVIILQSKSIGIWCNGNTADSGPAFPGSSPGSPTESVRESPTQWLTLSFFVPTCLQSLLSKDRASVFSKHTISAMASPSPTLQSRSFIFIFYSIYWIHTHLQHLQPILHTIHIRYKICLFHSLALFLGFHF